MTRLKLPLSKDIYYLSQFEPFNNTRHEIRIVVSFIPWYHSVLKIVDGQFCTQQEPAHIYLN